MPEVHQDHHICYRYALYSAPYSTCPRLTKLEVRGDSKLVKLYKRGELVKVHPRYSRGGRSTDPEDYPKELSAYAPRSPNYLRQQCRKLGESVGDFADNLNSRKIITMLRVNPQPLHNLTLWLSDFREDMPILARIANLSQRLHFQEQFPDCVLLS